METDQEIRISLTDSEWISLLDGEDDDSALSKCCANVSELRDALMQIVRDGRNKSLIEYELSDLKHKLANVIDGHGVPPTLKKLCDQIQLDVISAKHRPYPHELVNGNRDRPRTWTKTILSRLFFHWF